MDAVASSYHLGLREALEEFPINLALRLWPAIASRCGWELPKRPTSAAAAAAAARDAMTAHLARIGAWTGPI